MKKVRVRFAPSPTGFLHLGSARTALFNWLYARHTGGEFILRIEDTDRERSKKEYLDEILEDLKWMGIDWNLGPFFQSQRLDLYRQAAETILTKGMAYKEGEAVIYRVEKGRIIKIDDLIHGEIQFNTDEIKDQVLIKSDGFPAYNFACVVDDADLGITHIIRGDDHISNTPKQILFYNALGLEAPHFAHIPLMMGSDGAKLSKRHGGVSVSEYKEEGFLPEALVNYLLLLGWSPKKEEMISLKQAIKEFDVKDINNVQAKFDVDKLKWINGEYIRTKTTEELYPFIKAVLEKAGMPAVSGEEELKKIIELYKIRIKTFAEFIELTDYFFKDNFAVDEKGRKKYLDRDEHKANIRAFINILEKEENFSYQNIENICRKFAEEHQLKAADIIHPMRMAVSGKMKGAGLFEIMELLGRKKVLERIRKAVS